MNKVSFLLLGSFLGLCAPPTPETEVPEHMGPGDIDFELPRVYSLLKAEKLDVLWVGGYTAGWQIDRHELSGEVLGRWALVSYIQRRSDMDGACLLSDVGVYQEYVGGSFGMAKLQRRPNSNVYYNPSIGYLIECGVAEQVEFGYSGFKSGGDATSEPAADASSEVSEPVVEEPVADPSGG